MGHVSPINVLIPSLGARAPSKAQETIMTAALYDEVVTVAPARKLTVVRDAAPAPAPEKATRRVEGPTIVITDPLVDGAAHFLTIGVRHVYAALWRVGVLEVRA
jgi:hypothetical protein